MKSSLKSTLNGLLSGLYSVLDSAQVVVDQYLSESMQAQIKSGVTGGYAGGFSFAAVIYSIFFLLLLLGLLTVPCKCGCFLGLYVFTQINLLSSLLFLFFIFAIVYGVIAGVEIAVMFLATDVCNNHVSYIKNAEKTLTNQLGLNLNINLSISDTVFNIAKCSGNQTFLSAAGLADLDKFNISSQITPYKTTILSKVDTFDVAGVLGNTTNGFSNFTSTVTIDASVLNKIANVSNNMDASLAQYSNYSRFGFDENTFQNNINTFNTILLTQTSFTGPNYTASNISSFNENATIYNSQTQAFKNDMVNRRNAISALAPEYIRITTQINQARQNVTMMKNSLVNINALVSQIQSSISVISNTANVATTQLGSIQSLAAQMKTNASNFIDSALLTVQNSLANNQLLKCDYIGNMYNSIIDTGCSKMVPAIGIAGFASAVMVLVIALFFIALLELTKRICNPNSDVVVPSRGKELA